MKHVKAVFDQEGGLEGDFRLRRLRHIAGEERTLTMHKENQLRLMVDVEKCYFSPRLSTERLRVSDLTAEGEMVLNMFAGVGPYSITIAKRKKATVYSCELNTYAYELHVKNNALNKVEGRVRMFNEDASKLPDILDERFDRILMPHPSQSDRFLPAALRLARPGGWIHYYRHVSGYDLSEADEVIGAELHEILGEGPTFKTRKVREIGPRYLELVADIHLA
jgi:tRNA (guanine37-N1)-methyltransferase